MKMINRQISQLLKRIKTDAPQAPICNYADNYYGDQVCVIRR